MRDKTEQILTAAIKVFIKKGFLQTTTQEIAKEADVAEVTLYRKFSTKQNLFETVVKKALENEFHAKILKYAGELETENFLKEVLNDRLTALSKNQKLAKTLLAESFMGHLSDEINFPVIIFNGLKKGLDAHCTNLNEKPDTDLLARQIGGILLSTLTFPAQTPYHKLTAEEKEAVLTYHVNSLKVNLER
ncbi:TetR/AcrR family transcriptional regulator [Bacillus marinisedimentorum]|uniref:TetR/AcrR family transcriptional regulator n=1 Tax=Bacillus marinisedimentorum TaxID=1821260 RepID=UPI000872A04A|nr:TetR/AcrR family transcriptional regulator [Bacillus marinisedimentorum]